MTDDPLEHGASQTYNAASEYYDAPALAFRDHFSHRAVVRLSLPAGARVLDVCCGTAAASLAAAEAVGPRGSIVGIDFSPRQLDRARTKAQSLGVNNALFHPGDLSRLDLPAESFDAVLCVFGIFFVDDMPAALRGLWRLVRPGGVLSIATWAERTFEPGSSAFWDAVQTVRPDLNRHGFPWARIDTPDLLRRLFANAGVPLHRIESADAVQPLTCVDDWWTIVNGSGFRAIVGQMSPADSERVRLANLAALRAGDVSTIEAHVLFADAIKEAVNEA